MSRIRPWKWASRCACRGSGIDGRPRYRPHISQALRLAGTFCWLVGQRERALRFWKEGLTIGERLGTRSEPYAKRARELFVEVGLEVDLKELDVW